MFPNLSKIRCMPHLRALIIHLDFENTLMSWHSAVCKGLFEAVDGHKAHLQEFDLKFYDFVLQEATSTDTTTQLMQSGEEEPSAFRALRTLKIHSRTPLCGLKANEPRGFYRLYHYTYSVLEDLDLEFDGCGLLLQRLSQNAASLRRLKWTALKDKIYGDFDKMCFMRLLESYRGLKVCSIRTEHVKYIREVLKGLASAHGKTLSSLNLLFPESNGGLAAFHNHLSHGFSLVLNEHLHSFPGLRHLAIDFKHPDDVRMLTKVVQAMEITELRLIIEAFWHTFDDDLVCHVIHTLDPGVSNSVGQVFMQLVEDIFANGRCVQKLRFFFEEYYTDPSDPNLWYLSVMKDPSTNNLSWCLLDYDLRCRRLRRLAKEVGENFTPPETLQAIGSEERLLCLPISRVYEKFLDEWWSKTEKNS